MLLAHFIDKKLIFDDFPIEILIETEKILTPQYRLKSDQINVFLKCKTKRNTKTTSTSFEHGFGAIRPTLLAGAY